MTMMHWDNPLGRGFNRIHLLCVELTRLRLGHHRQNVGSMVLSKNLNPKKYVENPWTSDRAAFLSTTRITSSEKTPVGRQCPACFCLKFLHASAKRLRNYRTVVHIFRNIYFELLYPEISTNIAQNIFYFELLDPEIFTNSTQNIFYFQLPDPEIWTNNTQNVFGENADSQTVYIFLGDTNSVKLLVCALVKGYTERSQERTRGK